MARSTTTRKAAGGGRSRAAKAPTTAKPGTERAEPQSPPEHVPHPAPRPKDAPSTMRDLRLAREGRRKPAAKAAGNPLREGLRLERVPDPAAVVLFGATGDLAHRKVIPALYQLWRTHLLPHEFQLLGVARREYTDDTFRAEIPASLEKYARVQPIDEAAWETFAERISYQRCDFTDPAGY